MSTEPTAGHRAAHSRASLRPRVELARRHASGMTVRLLWNRETNVRAVSVMDVDGTSFDLVLSPDERALDVFYHPYAYAAMRGLTPEDSELLLEQQELASRDVNHICPTCAGGSEPGCGFCQMLRVEVRDGLAAMQVYLAKWAEFDAWDRGQASAGQRREDQCR